MINHLCSHQQQTLSHQSANTANFNSRSDNGNLFRASLVPVGMNPNPLVNGDTKSVSSIWKMSNSPGKLQQQQQSGHKKSQQFSSIENLIAEDNYQHYSKSGPGNQFYSPIWFDVIGNQW